MVVRRPETPEVALWNLVRVSLRWQDGWHEIGLHFPIAGYPLTAQAPVLDADWRIEPASDRDAVEANRRDILTNVARIRGLLGLTPERITWELNAEDALDPRDREALRQWQQRMQDGEV
jgi:hypothetical protein